MRPDVIPNSVHAFMQYRLPGEVDQCPACGRFNYSLVEFRTVTYARAENGEKHVITAFGAKPDPHLVITCAHCGFWWEQDVHHA